MGKLGKFGYIIIGAVITVFIVSLASPAIAALVTKTIQVATGVNIYIDGAKFYPKDVNGEHVDAFIYNGTTYLPIRAIGEAYGMDLQWEGSTSSVYVEKHDRFCAPIIKSIELLGTGGKLPVIEDWVFLQSESIIKVNYEGKADRVDFYTVPTGTETVLEQRLIGSVDVAEGDRTAQLKWDVPDSFMGYIWVMIYDGDIARTSDTWDFFIKAVYEK